MRLLSGRDVQGWCKVGAIILLCVQIPAAALGGGIKNLSAPSGNISGM